MVIEFPDVPELVIQVSLEFINTLSLSYACTHLVLTIDHSITKFNFTYIISFRT